MGKNRRYSKYSLSAGRSSKSSSSGRIRTQRQEHPLLTGGALVVGVLLAALCGRTLDARSVSASLGGTASLGAVSQVSDDPARAALNLESLPGSAAPNAVREIERISGVVGAAPLPQEIWATETPLFIGDTDVSGLLAQEFTLRRSLQSGYLPKLIQLSVNFNRPGTYFDLLLKDEKGAAQIVRMEEGNISVVYRSPSGIESERVRIPYSSKDSSSNSYCPEIALQVAGASEGASTPQSILCTKVQSNGGETTVIGSLPQLPVKGRFVSVSTNLVKSELLKFVIQGEVKGVGVEDRS